MACKSTLGQTVYNRITIFVSILSTISKLDWHHCIDVGLCKPMCNSGEKNIWLSPSILCLSCIFILKIEHSSCACFEFFTTYENICFAMEEIFSFFLEKRKYFSLKDNTATYPFVIATQSFLLWVNRNVIFHSKIFLFSITKNPFWCLSCVRVDHITFVTVFTQKLLSVDHLQEDCKNF